MNIWQFLRLELGKVVCIYLSYFFFDVGLYADMKINWQRAVNSRNLNSFLFASIEHQQNSFLVLSPIVFLSNVVVWHSAESLNLFLVQGFCF